MPKRLELNKDAATLEEVESAMRIAPTQPGMKIYQGIQFIYRGDSIQETADRLRVTEKTVRNWVHRFNNEGITGLAQRGKSGRPRKIPIDKFQAEYIPVVLDPKLVDEDNFTGIKFHIYLKDQCREELCYQTLLNYFHENNLSLVVPRPNVIDKQDQEKRVRFIEALKASYNNQEEIWFGDEVGFEGDPRPRARWVKVGSKPVNGRASEHLRFSAIGSVNPISGEFISLVMSGVNTEVFQVYLDELASSTDNRAITLVLDNASWHKAKKLNWYNIKPLFLPTYSPDFNPIENLWRYIKINHFSNWFAKNIEQLIDRICEAFNSLSKEQVKSTTNFDYLLK